MKRWHVALIMLVYAFALLLFCGSDGFLRMDYQRYDSAWFFMGGKAWMEGLTPYVDFSDSKGPLLWLIYGVGYLLSPHSFHGVFFIELLFYWATFSLLYRTARMLGLGGAAALGAAFLMGGAFFFPVIHFEMRGEDYCQLFYAMSLYAVVALFTGRGRVAANGFWLGLSVGGALLIKYNTGAVLALPALFSFFYLLFSRRAAKGEGWRLLAGGMAGFAAVVAPIVLFIAVFEDFGAFVNEYFLNTLTTIYNVTEGGDVDSHLQAVIQVFKDLKGIFILVSFASVLSMIAVCRGNRPLAWCVAIWFVGVFIMVVLAPWGYYFLNLSIFWLFLFVLLLRNVRTVTTGGSIWIGACTVGAVAIGATSIFSNGEFYRTGRAAPYRRASDRATELAREYEARTGEKPTIAYFEMIDLGLHVKNGMLPGVKYWALQAGCSEEMHNEHINSILETRPAFIVVDIENINRLGDVRDAYQTVDTIYGLVPWWPDDHPALLLERQKNP